MAYYQTHLQSCRLDITNQTVSTLRVRLIFRDVPRHPTSEGYAGSLGKIIQIGGSLWE